MKRLERKHAAGESGAFRYVLANRGKSSNAFAPQTRDVVDGEHHGIHVLFQGVSGQGSHRERYHNPCTARYTLYCIPNRIIRRVFHTDARIGVRYRIAMQPVRNNGCIFDQLVPLSSIRQV